MQRVARQDGSAADAFRGYQGRLAQGTLAVGDAVRIEPSGDTSTVAALFGLNGSIAQAQVGEMLTVTLADDVAVARGNSLVAAASPITPSTAISAALPLRWFLKRSITKCFASPSRMKMASPHKHRLH